ncbi:MAG: DUF3592 domain-containing protein [Burkholderiales bacterium]
MNLFYLAGSIGLILTLGALGRIVSNFRFLARSARAQGTFVRWEITEPGTVGGPSGTQGKRSYRPIIAFRAADGTEHRVTGSIYILQRHAPTSPTKGDLPIRYDPANPAQARLATFTDFWLFPILFLVIGIVSLAFAARAYRDH